MVSWAAALSGLRQKREKKTPTSAVTVKIKPKSSRLSVQEKGFSVMNSVQTKLDWLPGSKFVRFEMVEESKIVWYIKIYHF